MNQGHFHFLLYGFLALLAAALVAVLMLPVDESAESHPASGGIDSNNSDALRNMRGQHNAIIPIPVRAADEADAGKIALGDRLFNDPQLSADGSISCASCHIIATGGDDGRKRSIGVNAAVGDVNSPTVFNSVYNFRQFWDGRAANLAEQVAGPILNPVEMASSWPIVIRRLENDADYRRDFQREYGGAINETSVSDAIARYETTLVTPNSPFDRYLNGNPGAIGADALEGYNRFTDYGCISCHQGINVGGNFFQRFGVMGDYFADRGNLTKADLGRYNITGQEEDRYVFKVPSLRNVALTAPYFHDGSIATLDEAVDIMGRYQLGRSLSVEDRRLIAAFLDSLTGEFRGERLQP
ncbi:MAG: cytochrome-c peroxidase [Azoarcus sp.]|jgi:cytochrome c peroxidase|nr:cytochrome-c peroxidase [Azoarcus sp.]